MRFRSTHRPTTVGIGLRENQGSILEPDGETKAADHEKSGQAFVGSNHQNGPAGF